MSIQRSVVVGCLLAGILALNLHPFWRVLLDGDRPFWSVCGQDLCLCQPVPLEPDCPLCLSGNAGAEGCSGVGIDQARIPVRGDASVELLAGASRAGEGVLFALMLLFTSRDADSAVLRAGIAVVCDAVGVPDGASREVPTPPPRA